MKNNIKKQEILKAIREIKNDLARAFLETDEGRQIVSDVYSQNEILKALIEAAEYKQVDSNMLKIFVDKHCHVDEDLPIFTELVYEYKTLVKKVMSM